MTLCKTSVTGSLRLQMSIGQMNTLLTDSLFFFDVLLRSITHVPQAPAFSRRLGARGCSATSGASCGRAAARRLGAVQFLRQHLIQRQFPGYAHSTIYGSHTTCRCRYQGDTIIPSTH
jgi:hypothetical protein